MKILAISHEYPPIGGGGANACMFLSKEMVKMGHEVTVVTSCFDDLINTELDDGVTVIRVKALRKKKDKSTFFEMLSFLINAVRTTNKLAKVKHYDISVIFFGIPSGPVGLMLRRKYGIPYVIRFGGGDIPGSQKRFELIYKAINPFIRSIWKNASALIANSEGLRERAERFENRYEIKIIENGVDSDFFKRQTDYVIEDEIQLLFVSRLIEGKGLQFIIPKMREINDRVGKKVSLTIVGDGPYREELERLSNEYVTFLGRKEKEKLPSIYSSAHVFILPSLSEGMPNVVLEAMAASLPIAMTDCEGSKELIKDNGMVSSIDCFVDNLIELLRNNENLIRMSENSRKRATEMFTWESKAARYLDIMRKSV